MSAGRLVLHSVIILAACLLGYLVGRLSVSDSPGVAAAMDSGPSRPVADVGTSWSGRETGALAERGDWGHDDKGVRGFFGKPDREKASAAIPSRIMPPRSARPVESPQPAASHEEVVQLVDAALPGLNETERTTWVEEFEGLPVETIRELLLLRNGLSSGESGPRRGKTNQHP